jgi:hypothetical protein
MFSQAKTGLSAPALKCVNYLTAWLMNHQVMEAMADRKAAHRLGGAVELEGACLGGERAGGEPGRGSENQVPAAAVVSLNDKGRTLYVKAPQIPDFTNNAISKWAQSLRSGAKCSKLAQDR